jgi:predicted Rossmann fold nucleotide-binding protein DprA/Smf involved in DNA uptake
MESQGNRSFLEKHKTAFLCSRRCPASVVLKAYDWAKMMRNEEKCVISGNHSQIEKDVLHYLLKGSQPIIVALARGLKKRVDPEIKEALSSKRLLFVSPFETNITRVTQETANKRNEMMAEMADEIFVAYAQPGGNLERLIFKLLKSGNTVTAFDVEENKELIEAGAIAIT